MTNPRGRCFISYRRLDDRVVEAVRVRDALRDRGIPTWRDLDDLKSLPTEDELRRVLREEDTACAVVLANPDVQESSMITRVEAPEIFKRARADQVFFVQPVLCGLSYQQANESLGAPAGFQDLGGWNLLKLEDELTEADAIAVAESVLKERLSLIANERGDAPFEVGIFTRRTDSELAHDLRFDFSAYFDGRKPRPGSFDVIERALLSAASTWMRSGARKTIVCDGQASFAAATLFGAVFSPLAGFDIAWRQKLLGHAPELWRHENTSSQAKLSVSVTSVDPSANAIVLALGINADIENSVAEYLRNQTWSPRAIINAKPDQGPFREGVRLGGEDATALSLQALDAVHSVTQDRYLSEVDLHVFMACPLAMAFLIGQKLNKVSKCHLYDYIADPETPYLHVHSFCPSNFVYR